LRRHPVGRAVRIHPARRLRIDAEPAGPHLIGDIERVGGDTDHTRTDPDHTGTDTDHTGSGGEHAMADAVRASADHRAAG
jgi:hypothetical protein